MEAPNKRWPLPQDEPVRRAPFMRPGAGPRLSGTVSAVLVCGTALLSPAEPAATNAPGNQVLLNDNLGKLVAVRTNAVPPKVLPPPGISITKQVPSPAAFTSFSIPCWAI
jgi:hypothetical protein